MRPGLFACRRVTVKLLDLTPVKTRLIQVFFIQTADADGAGDTDPLTRPEHTPEYGSRTFTRACSRPETDVE